MKRQLLLSFGMLVCSSQVFPGIPVPTFAKKIWTSAEDQAFTDAYKKYKEIGDKNKNNPEAHVIKEQLLTATVKREE